MIALPSKQAPQHALAAAVCFRCGEDRQTVQAKGMGALGRIWPKLRPVKPTLAEGGRA